MRGLILYELNEVPWRVVDRHVRRRPDGHVAALLGRADTWTTRSVDDGELHPWTTWPTLHRGVANAVHGIRFLNQDLSGAADHPPVWSLLADAGVPVGVFGSLQSYPVLQGPAVRFHVPDTFAAGPETYPARYTPFQAFNLRMTGDNKAVAGDVGVSAAAAAARLPAAGVGAASLGRTALQLVNERRDRLYTRRRALLQPVLALDVFRHAFERGRPRFATFFTNHVAGIMHRYWRHAFPDDFDAPLPDSHENRFHARSLDVAMDLADRQVGVLLRLARKHDADLLVCSSMGQEAIDRGEYVPEVGLRDFAVHLDALGLGGERVEVNLAMHPDVSLRFADAGALERVRARLEAVSDTAGSALWRRGYAPVGLTLNLRLERSAALASDGRVRIDGRELPAANAGLFAIERDDGTGYHQPEGIALWDRGAGGGGHDARTVVDSRQVMPAILAHFGVEAPSYAMAPPVADAPRANAA